MTKGSSKKQIIIPLSLKNRNKFIERSSSYITYLNKMLKSIKSEIMADFVQSDHTRIMIVTNKVATSLDLQTIKKYIKEIYQIDLEKVKASRLPQSKSYLKIIGILYLLKHTNTPISVDVVETIIKNNHIFNNIAIIFRSRIIKVFLKSNMAIIWLNIWDIQSESKTKGLINKYFNIESYITTICSTNMNLGISQCKNCWK